MATPVIKIKRKNSGTGAPSSLQPGELAADITSQVLYIGNSSGTPVEIGKGSVPTGGVTSVALTAPNIFSVSGSPITSGQTGTLSLNLEQQAAKTFFAAPISSIGIPTFRTIEPTDLASNPSSGYFLKTDGTNLSWAAGGTGGGTVTSVGLNAPSIFNVANSPVTTNGTINLSLSNQNTNTFFSGPSSGSAAAPTFRSIVPTDLASNPSSGYFLKTDGTNLSWAAGGTGGGTPAGSNGSIQIYDSGIFSSRNNFTFSNNNSTLGSSYGYTFNIGPNSTSGNNISFLGKGPETNGTSNDTFVSQINLNSSSNSTQITTQEYTVDSTYADTISFSSVNTYFLNTTVSNTVLDSGSTKFPYITITPNSSSSNTSFRYYGIIPNDYVTWTAGTNIPTPITTNTPYKIAYMQNLDSTSATAGGFGLVLSDTSENLISSYSTYTTATSTTSSINCGTKRPYHFVVGSDGTSITSHLNSYSSSTASHGLYPGDVVVLYMANTISFSTVAPSGHKSTTAAPKVGFTVTQIVANNTNEITITLPIIPEHFNIGDYIYIEGSNISNLNGTYYIKSDGINLVNKTLILVGLGSTIAAGTYTTTAQIGNVSCNLLVPRKYYVVSTPTTSTFTLSDVSPTSTAVKFYTYTYGTPSGSLTTTGCFFRRLPAYSFSTDPNASIGDYVSSMTNTDNLYLTKFILAAFTDETSGTTAKTKLIVSNGLDLNVGDTFYIDREIHRKDYYTSALLPGVLYEISEINYNLMIYSNNINNNIDTIGKGDLKTDNSLGKQSYNSVANRSQNAYMCVITIKNINSFPANHALNSTITFGGTLNSIAYSENPGSLYYDKKSTHMILIKKPPKVINKYTANSKTYYVLDRLLWHPNTSTAPKVTFYKNFSTTTYMKDRGKDIFNIRHNSTQNSTIGSTGIYLTSTDQLVLGKYNENFTSNPHTNDPVQIFSSTDTSAFIILKKPNYYNDPDNILYKNLNNNFRLYINPGTAEPINPSVTEMQFWVLGSYGVNATTPPDPSSPSSFLRWFRISKTASGISTLVGGETGSGLKKEDIYDIDLGEVISQISLSDEVPINTSLTVPLLKSPEATDLNITTTSGDSNINITIPESNTDVALSSGSIYITSGLDAGDVYVQSAEDIYLTSQNVRVSGNLIVDGYIQSGTGFQGDNTDAEEPIIGLVMDGGTF